VYPVAEAEMHGQFRGGGETEPLGLIHVKVTLDT